MEIKVDGKWQRICDSNWSKKEADVVCRQLGYGNATDGRGFFTDQEEPGRGSTGTGRESGRPTPAIPIAYSDVTCEGTEISLTGCSLKPYLTKSLEDQCGMATNVSVVCQGPGGE